MSKRREPEVIVFQEPTSSQAKRGRQATRERDKFLRGDVSEIFSSLSDVDNQSDDESTSNHIDLKETLREVQSLASSSFMGKERKKFEEEQMRTLGAKPSKQEYVPYPHYQRVSNDRRDKERRKTEELRLTQMASGKRKKETKSKVRGKGRWKDSIKSLEPAVGKFKGGVLKLSKQDLVKVKRGRVNK